MFAKYRGLTWWSTFGCNLTGDLPPSVKNVVDVLRQGRCTLLSALQNQQIMMLECIISAYTISALSLEDGSSASAGASQYRGRRASVAS